MLSRAIRLAAPTRIGLRRLPSTAVAMAPKTTQMFIKSNLPQQSGLSTKPMVAFQSDNLPQFPVPELRDTLERLKHSAGPLALTQEEFLEFISVVDAFGADGGVGQKLHRLLNQKASQTSNWLVHDWWLNKAYLEGRDPIMIWSNPGFAFPKVTVEEGSKAIVNQISRTIAGFLDFRDQLKAGRDPENSDGKTCMDQYRKIFGSCRLPGHPSDVGRSGDLSNEASSIVISRKNKFYQVTLPVDPKLRSGVLQDAVRAILEDKDEADLPFGSFTALPREKWADIFAKLDQNAVDAISESQFVISIDHVTNEDDYDADYLTSMGKQALHADASNIGNRWFDKTIQLIFVLSNDGKRYLGTGLNYEHTFFEAPLPARLIEHVVKFLDLTSANWPGPSNTTLSGDVLKRLSFDSLTDLRADVASAMEEYEEFAGSLDMTVLKFGEYGKDFIKSQKQSPDSWMQVAICWAYAKLHKQLGACYETAATRKYAFGRTEVIRSVTTELQNLYLEPNFHYLTNAIKSHNQLARASVSGRGIDRLLLGLRAALEEVRDGSWKWGVPSDVKVTERDVEALEKLYNHELFVRSKHFNLSTSQVSAKWPEMFCCYGPLVTDGYGCCYNPTKNHLTFAISAFKGPLTCFDVQRFSDELSDTLLDMQKMFLTQSKL